MAKTHTVTFEVTADNEMIQNAIKHELTEVSKGEATGKARADLEEVFEKAVQDISIAETSAPMPVALAVEDKLLRSE